MFLNNATKIKEEIMGFFKDFKRDFAQAVNELMPDKDELANEYDDEDMVNTFDENDNMDIAPEDMMEDLDDYTIDNMDITAEPVQNHIYEEERPESDYEEAVSNESDSVFDTVPSAEIITEQSEFDDEDIEAELVQELVTELVSEAPAGHTMATDVEDESYGQNLQEELQDELKQLEELDEEDMLENTEDALEVDYEKNNSESVMNEEYLNVDLNQAVQAAILKNEADKESLDDDNQEEDMVVEKSTIAADMKEKEQEINSILTDDTTYITKGTTIKGNLETDGSIDIIGTVEGNVSCGGKLIIGGIIRGNVTAGEVYANAAKIEGEVISDGSVKIGVGSVVVGNVAANSAVVAGAVNGDIDVHGPVIVDSTAVIMGNIKSRSVQINNGAVIEGFCSQCYSEIDVKSFFE